MTAPVAPIDPATLRQAETDIRRFIPDAQDRQHALKQLGSIHEYAPGDERGCTWEEALDNCEQLKGYFPPSTPDVVRANIDAIAREIKRIEKEETPGVWRFLTSPFLLIAAAVIVIVILAVSYFGSR